MPPAPKVPDRPRIVGKVAENSIESIGEIAAIHSFASGSHSAAPDPLNLKCRFEDVVSVRRCAALVAAANDRCNEGIGLVPLALLGFAGRREIDAVLGARVELAQQGEGFFVLDLREVFVKLPDGPK